MGNLQGKLGRTDMNSVLTSLTNKYTAAISDLRDKLSDSIELRIAERAQAVQNIALDLAQDLNLLISYRLAEETRYDQYYLKHIEAAIGYLKEIRQDLTLFITAEKL